MDEEDDIIASHQLNFIESESKYFGCNLCQEKFIFKSSLIEHIKTKHTKLKTAYSISDDASFAGDWERSGRADANEKMYKCYVCDKPFGLQLLLDEHLQVEHSNPTTVCNICKTVFLSMGDRDKHVLRIHKKEKKYKCVNCEERFSFRLSLAEHHEAKHSKSGTLCTICTKIYFSKGEYEKHLKNHTNYTEHKTHSCLVCFEEFRVRMSLVRHLEVKHSKSVVVCAICTKVFFSIGDYGKHLKIHVSLYKAFWCVLCDEGFDVKTSLVQHVKADHTKLDDRLFYTCQLCRKRFLLLKDLHLHTRNHANKRMYSGVESQSVKSSKVQAVDPNVKRPKLLHASKQLCGHEECGNICDSKSSPSAGSAMSQNSGTQEDLDQPHGLLEEKMKETPGREIFAASGSLSNPCLVKSEISVELLSEAICLESRRTDPEISLENDCAAAIRLGEPPTSSGDFLDTNITVKSEPQDFRREEEETATFTEKSEPQHVLRFIKEEREEFSVTFNEMFDTEALSDVKTDDPEVYNSTQDEEHYDYEGADYDDPLFIGDQEAKCAVASIKAEPPIQWEKEDYKSTVANKDDKEVKPIQPPIQRECKDTSDSVNTVCASVRSSRCKAAHNPTSNLPLDGGKSEREGASTPVKYTCILCKKVVLGLPELLLHVQHHNRKGIYRMVCICGRSYLRHQHFISHFMTHYGRKFKCGFCSTDALPVEELRQHAMTHEQFRTKNLLMSLFNEPKYIMEFQGKDPS